jgi:hypothetical protein
MGRKYKVLAICSAQLDKKLVPGFESFSFSPAIKDDEEAQRSAD